MANVEVTMPKMGESITEGTVIAWLKQPGDAVELDEPLLEIGTDKVDTEVPSPAAGVLKEVLVEEGDTVEVGTAIAMLETEAEADGDDEPAEAPPEGAAQKDAEQHDEEKKEQEVTQAQDQEEADAEAEPVEEPQAEAEEPAPSEEDEPQPEAKPAGGGEIEVTMPKMGESITEGTVIAWLKQPGDAVELDEPLLEIGTDKVDTEVPSPAAGVLKEVLVEEGDTVDVGTALAILTSEEAAGAEEAAPQQGDGASREEADVQAEPSGTSEPEPSGDGAMPEPEPEGAGEKVGRRGSDGRFFSPLVRSIAEKEGLSMRELEDIEGSGREGRVTKEDVLNYIEARGERPAGQEETTEAKETKKTRPEPQRKTAPERATGGSAPPAPPPIPGGDGYDGRVEIIEMDRMRQIIAEHMVRSQATSAHVTSFAEADVTNLYHLRERNRQVFYEREGIKLTFTPFFVRAAVQALRQHPLLNASVDLEEKQILIKKDLHLGIAVAIERKGLVAPVIRDAGQKNLVGLAHAAADLAQRARSKQLQPDELQGGTFTITNIGSLGSIMGTPIINQPQVAILATGAVKKRPVVIEDERLGDVVAVRHMMYVSLSYDHRIIDGAMGASFLQRFADEIEGLDPNADL